MNFDDFKSKVEEAGLNYAELCEEFKSTGSFSDDIVNQLNEIGIEKSDLEELLKNLDEDFDDEDDEPEQKEPKELKIIETTCPLPMEVLKEFFEDKENTAFKINYRGGKLDADALMIYLSNLNLNADFDEETYNDRDALKELVAAYMKTTTALVNIEQLAKEALAICCQHRDVRRDDIFVPEAEEEDFEDEDDLEDNFRYFERLNCAKDFIEENLDIVERWCTMLDSSIVYNMHCLDDPTFNEFIDKTFEKIDDPDYVGINYVNCYSNEWIGLYIGSIPDCVEDPKQNTAKYFVNQFNEYRFKGNNMFHYFNHENNVLSVFSQVVTSGEWEEGVPEELMEYPEGWVPIDLPPMEVQIINEEE